jgi:hypothetical protein
MAYVLLWSTRDLSVCVYVCCIVFFGSVKHSIKQTHRFFMPFVCAVMQGEGKRGEQRSTNCASAGSFKDKESNASAGTAMLDLQDQMRSQESTAMKAHSTIKKQLETLANQQMIMERKMDLLLRKMGSSSHTDKEEEGEKEEEKKPKKKSHHTTAAEMKKIKEKLLEDHLDSLVSQTLDEFKETCDHTIFIPLCQTWPAGHITMLEAKFLKLGYVVSWDPEKHMTAISLGNDDSCESLSTDVKGTSSNKETPSGKETPSNKDNNQPPNQAQVDVKDTTKTELDLLKLQVGDEVEYHFANIGWARCRVYEITANGIVTLIRTVSSGCWNVFLNNIDFAVVGTHTRK